MWMEMAATVGGLVVLVWGADRFVEGAAATAGHFRMPPLLIGMVIIGFGTSAPEIVISTVSSMAGDPGLALGNAFGSNIANIGLILGVAALMQPVSVHSQVVRRELPLLLAATGLTWWLLADGEFSSADAGVQLVLFSGLVGWSVWEALKMRRDALAKEYAQEIPRLALSHALFWIGAGLLLLVVSSRLVVWGAVGIAHSLGVSDLVIGLTVIAVGTSLPELASSIAAVRKGEHDLALGNVLGSNLFNTLLVAGLSGAIFPHRVDPDLVSRDLPFLFGFTCALLAVTFSGKRGRISRFEGGVLLAAFLGYTGWVVLGGLLGMVR